MSGYDRRVSWASGVRDRDVSPRLTPRSADELSVEGQDVTLKVYPDADHDGSALDSISESTTPAS
ncbi:hypothetical protein PDG61_10280 [Mycolicibacterium sp. BiH015]|uniref:hypothetical protein n=1 Tax=Mycolicibacterium sp. BiH015 TaxID=3018808 RepID=UPI0022E59359|nr:hypothetical protein [Mycolicibacterium sp. BiH015]MDA2891295.1 hypothetical protein [Mycolicibacterium sp. BiH015]